MRVLTFHEEAGAEIIEAATYYEERMPGLGMLFLGALDEAVQNVLAHPDACQLVGSEIRRSLMRRFPYSLLYVPLSLHHSYTFGREAASHCPGPSDHALRAP